MSVRPLAESDLPQVIDLYWRHMRHREGSAPAAFRSAFRDLYFTNPWVDDSFPPLVYEAGNGKIIGFLGNMVRKMRYNGRSLRVAFGGNLVVQPDSRSHLAAPRLLGAFLAGKHDISLTDSANDTSRKLLEGLRFRTFPALNIHWARPLRPAQYVVYTLSRTMRASAAATLAFATTPLCDLADRVAVSLSGSPFCQLKPRLQGEEADVEALLRCFNQSHVGYSMWPEYDSRSLDWLLTFMEGRTARGVLRKMVLHDENQRTVGWYIYYVKPGSVGEVVQVVGEPKVTKDILDHLFYDAWEQGVIGLHGVVDRRRIPEYSDKGCFFTCRGGWTVAHSRNAELLGILERGDVFMSRLDGEWCLDPGD